MIYRSVFSVILLLGVVLAGGCSKDSHDGEQQTGPAILLVQPNGGEDWIVGVPDTIQWTSDQIVGDVQILLSRDSGHNWPYIIASAASNTGRFVWTPTSPASASCRIRVVSVNSPDVRDDSNGDFVVHSPPQWEVQNNGGTTRLWSVFFTDLRNGYVVGGEWDASAVILRTTDGGTHWYSSDPLLGTHLRGVTFCDASSGWAVGGNGTILHTTNGGLSWTAQASGVTTPLYNVAATDASHAWVVGDSGTILYTQNGGATWSRQNPDTGTSSVGLADVSFASAQRGVAAGWQWSGSSSNNLQRTTNSGTVWQAVSHAPGSGHLYGVFLMNEQYGWAVGIYQCLRTTNGGATWEDVGLVADGAARVGLGVSFISPTEGWVVGADGAILHTVNRGSSWERQDSGVSSQLNDVCFLDATHGWAVGDNGVILHYHLID